MTPRKHWKNTHLKGASVVTQRLWRVIVCRISQQTTGIFYPSLSTLQKIMILLQLNCGLWKTGSTKLSLMFPLWVEGFLNEELVAVSQWCQASQGPTPHSWATCPPPPGFDPSACKTDPDHRWEGFKEFYPNAMGLSKGSKLALQLVWFPFYAPLWKLDLHFVLLYRALSYSISVPLRVGSCLAAARSHAQLTHHDPYLEGRAGVSCSQMRFFLWLPAGTLGIACLKFPYLLRSPILTRTPTVVWLLDSCFCLCQQCPSMPTWTYGVALASGPKTGNSRETGCLWIRIFVLF